MWSNATVRIQSFDIRVKRRTTNVLCKHIADLEVSAPLPSSPKLLLLPTTVFQHRSKICSLKAGLTCSVLSHKTGQSNVFVTVLYRQAIANCRLGGPTAPTDCTHSILFVPYEAEQTERLMCRSQPSVILYVTKPPVGCCSNTFPDFFTKR